MKHKSWEELLNLIQCFSFAIRVIDGFHVQNLAIEALQEIRIKDRWQALELENELIVENKAKLKYLNP
ncbi:hypothetical protein D1631_18090 [Chryseobacterium nematophagum]|uniref:Uncharacterized protein n=1 Tax=Chryseobacterium nematophagum TaxID=2305228 RepID=A0A3M7TLJ2_9FLAO|nr:hypothetical protein D1631_18090 [Chryseobacterium nematophagum]